MADNNQLKASQIDFAHDDPFAELTRIMGHDPRAKEPEATVSDDSAFDIDLEKELMGELDFSDFDAEPAAAEPAAPQAEAWQPAASWAPEERAPVAGENTSADEAFAAYDASAVDYDDDTQAFGDEGGAPGALEAELGFQMEDAFALDDVIGDMEQASADDRADADRGDETPAVSFEAAPVQDAPSAVEPDLSLDDDFSDELDRELSALDDAEEATVSDASQTPLTAAVPAWTRSEDQPAFEAADEFDLADLDMELDALGDDAGVDLAPALDVQPEPVAAAPDWNDEPEAFDAPVDGVDSEDEVVSYAAEPEVEPAPVVQSAAPAELSLEDELAALLSDEPPASAPVAAAPVVAAVAAAPAIAPAHQSDPSDEGWHPTVNTFGRANFPRSPVHETPKPPVESATPAPEAAFSDDDFDLSDDDFDLVDAHEDAPELRPVYVAPVAAHTPAPASPASYSAPAPVAAPIAPVSMLDESDFSDIFGDEQDLETKVEETPSYAPAPAYTPGPSTSYASPTARSVPADDVERFARAGIDALASWRPEQPAAVAAAPVAAAVGMSAFSAAKSRGPEAPDVETVDVSEAAFAMQDDLDIPDFDYGASDATPRLYDDLEGEIAQAFGDVSFDEPDTTASAPLPSAEWAAPMTASATSATPVVRPGDACCHGLRAGGSGLSARRRPVAG
jgi:hypothetical protein